MIISSQINSGKELIYSFIRVFDFLNPSDLCINVFLKEEMLQKILLLLKINRYIVERFRDYLTIYIYIYRYLSCENKKKNGSSAEGFFPHNFSFI